MYTVYDREHNALHEGKSLRIIRDYVSKSAKAGNLPKEVRISKAARNVSGSFFITFEDGSYFKAHFADYRVLKLYVKHWRNLHGVQLYVNNRGAGKISYSNHNLN